MRTIPARARALTTLITLMVAGCGTATTSGGPDASTAPPTNEPSPNASPPAEMVQPNRTGPPPRAYAPLIDVPGPGVVLYQGQIAPPDHPDSGWFYDMWTFDPVVGWAAAPSVCELDQCIQGVPETFADGPAFDTGSGRLVIAGEGTTVTWAPKTGAWEELTTTGPTGTLGARTAYDIGSDRMILFGGLDIDANSVSDQTWAYDLDTNTWTEMDPAERPGAGNFHAMAYDAESDRIILFGGADLNDNPYTDTWAYDFEADTWERMAPDVSPPGRYYHGMAYDAANDRVILFGGTDAWAQATFNDTWAYDYNTDTWTEIDTPGPTVRAWHAMAYDEASQSVVVFGGGLDRVATTDETWVFDVTTDAWRLHAPATLEADGCRYDGPMALRAGPMSIALASASDAIAYAALFSLAADDFAAFVEHVDAERERAEEGLPPLGPPDFATEADTLEVAAGERGTLSAELEPGTYGFVCAEAGDAGPGIDLFGPITVHP
jgi:N-acetylneuraminic acid mutarotase